MRKRKENTDNEEKIKQETIMNNYTGIGRLTKDVEVKSLSNGTYLIQGTIAINNIVKKDGAYEQEASFIDFKWFGDRAAKVAKYLLKGAQIGIEANLKQERWEDKEGNKRSKIILVLNNITLLGKKESSEPSPQLNTDNLEDEEIPF